MPERGTAIGGDLGSWNAPKTESPLPGANNPAALPLLPKSNSSFAPGDHSPFPDIFTWPSRPIGPQLTSSCLARHLLVVLGMGLCGTPMESGPPPRVEPQQQPLCWQNRDRSCPLETHAMTRALIVTSAPQLARQTHPSCLPCIDVRTEMLIVEVISATMEATRVLEAILRSRAEMISPRVSGQTKAIVMQRVMSRS